MTEERRAGMDDLKTEMAKIASSMDRLNDKVDTGMDRLTERIDAGTDRLNDKVDHMKEMMEARIKETRNEIIVGDRQTAQSLLSVNEAIDRHDSTFVGIRGRMDHNEESMTEYGLRLAIVETNSERLSKLEKATHDLPTLASAVADIKKWSYLIGSAVALAIIGAVLSQVIIK